MLQFRTTNSDKYIPAEQVQMALEGGCMWIQYGLDGHSESADSEIREDLLPVVEMCREAEVFLVLEDRPELARELGIHGVHLASASLARLTEMRELLGPEAVIGVGVTKAEEVVAMRNLDIDYATLPADMSLDEMKHFVGQVRGEGVEMPIVASGDIILDNVEEVMATGVSGVLVGRAIVDAADPVDYTAKLIEALQGGKQ